MTALAGRASTVVLLALALLVTAPAPAALAADTTISATVLDASTGRTVPGADLRLVLYRDGVQFTSLTGRTGTDGVYRFTALPTVDGWTGEVVTRYQQVEYRSETLTPIAGQDVRTTVRVYPPSAATDSVVTDSWTVWVDVRDGVTAIEQDVVVTNSGTTGYVGTGQVSGGRPAVLRLPVLADARNFQYLGFLSERDGLRQGDEFIHTAVLAPGRSQGALRYETAAVGDLAFALPLATTNFTLLVPDGATVRAPQLTLGGRTEDSGLRYQVYTATGLRAGDVVRAAVTVPAPAPGRSWRTPVLVTVVMAAMLALLGYRLRRRPAPAGAGHPSGTSGKTGRSGKAGSGGAIGGGAAVPGTRLKNPTSRPDPPVPPATAQPVTQPVTQAGGPLASDVADLLVDHVALLDLAYQAGGLPDQASYQRRRRELTQRLAQVWSVAGPATKVSDVTADGSVR